MNMNKFKGMRNSAQAGFTLIELIVVIVILGILAATALPKFANLSADARNASLKAVGGALMSTSAMAHSKYLIQQTSPVVFEGASIIINTTTGYPQANDAGFIAAAGISANDYATVQPSNSGSDTFTPVTSATQVGFVPKGISGTTSGATCNIVYTAATTANTVPSVSVPACT